MSSPLSMKMELSSERLRTRWPEKSLRAARAVISGISAAFVFLETDEPHQWSARGVIHLDTEQLGEFGRQRNDPKLLVDAPLVPRRGVGGLASSTHDR